MGESLPAPGFDLARTLDSGQVFHWQADGTGWRGVIRDREVRVEQRGEMLLVENGHRELVSRYFALDHPMPAILASFPPDEPLRRALEFGHGLRIIRQEPWECVATFITSALKQVPQIRVISGRLRERYGLPTGRGHTYPEAGALARAGEEALRLAGLGFRARHLAGAARMVADGEVELEGLRSLDTGEIRRALCRLPGVGVKVADCVLLFAYGRLEAFPVDVWIGRVLREEFFGGRPVPDRELREWADRYFGCYGGYAQQFLFHHARLTRGRRIVSTATP